MPTSRSITGLGDQTHVSTLAVGEIERSLIQVFRLTV